MKVIMETLCRCRRICDIHHIDYENGVTMLEAPGAEKIESVHIPGTMLEARVFRWKGRVDDEFALRVFEETRGGLMVEPEEADTKRD